MDLRATALELLCAGRVELNNRARWQSAISRFMNKKWRGKTEILVIKSLVYAQV